jgi:hypothetical protein
MNEKVQIFDYVPEYPHMLYAHLVTYAVFYLKFYPVIGLLVRLKITLNEENIHFEPKLGIVLVIKSLFSILLKVFNDVLREIVTIVLKTICLVRSKSSKHV